MLIRTVSRRELMLKTQFNWLKPIHSIGIYRSLLCLWGTLLITKDIVKISSFVEFIFEKGRQSKRKRSKCIACQMVSPRRKCLSLRKSGTEERFRFSHQLQEEGTLSALSPQHVAQNLANRRIYGMNEWVNKWVIEEVVEQSLKEE